MVKDLSALLDVVTPQTFHDVISKKGNGVGFIELDDVESAKAPVNIEENQSVELEVKSQEQLKEKFILDDLKTDVKFDFDNYVQTVLKPVKRFDSFLDSLLIGKFSKEQLEEYRDIIRQNAALSRKADLDLITKMHTNLYLSLEGILQGRLAVSKDLIEMMRACLIVIVAVIRSKEVDISGFLDKSEELSELLQS